MLGKYPNADYYYDENLPKFVGTWVWQSGSDRFEIEIIKGVMNLGKMSMESALGGVKYIKNGVVVNNDLQTSSYTFSNTAIIGNTDDDNNLTILIRDKAHKCYYKGVMILDTKDQRKAVVKFSKDPREYRGGEYKPSNIIYYPSGITLIKK